MLFRLNAILNFLVICDFTNKLVFCTDYVLTKRQLVSTSFCVLYQEPYNSPYHLYAIGADGHSFAFIPRCKIGMLNSNLHAEHLQLTFNELNPTNTPG